MNKKEETSPLKNILSSPLRNVPAVPTPDWSISSAPASSPISSAGRTNPQSSLTALIPPTANTTDPYSNVTLQNCVATVDLNCQLNLQTITFRTRNSEYNPMRFHGVVMRIREPRSTALIFKSGKIVCTGARTEEDALLASKKFAKIIQKLGFNVRFSSFKIQNIVATCDLRFPIKLENLNQMHGQFSSYEPELFPALIYRMVKPRLVLLIFVNGKIVFTGAKSRQDLKDALDNIYPILKSFKKN